MASNYAAFDVLIDNDDGTTSPVVSTTVHVFDVTHTTALADTATNANGHVAGASVAPAAGTVLRFSVDLGNGRCGYAEAVTS